MPLGFLVLKVGRAARRQQRSSAKRCRWCATGSAPSRRFKTATVVKRLPKTRSGKILRGVMQKIADSQEYKVPATIDDPAILDEIEAALKHLGYAAKLGSG